MQKALLLFYSKGRSISTTGSNIHDSGAMEEMAPQERQAQFVNRIAWTRREKRSKTKGTASTSSCSNSYFLSFEAQCCTPFLAGSGSSCEKDTAPHGRVGYTLPKVCFSFFFSKQSTGERINKKRYFGTFASMMAITPGLTC